MDSAATPSASLFKEVKDIIELKKCFALITSGASFSENPSMNDARWERKQTKKLTAQKFERIKRKKKKIII